MRIGRRATTGTAGSAAKAHRMPTSDEVREALKTVEDPELHMGIVDLGLLYGVEVAGTQNEDVTVTMTLTSPMCPVGPMFKEAVESKVRSLEGVKKANVEITFTPPWDPRTMASDDAKVLLGIW
jgi:metal-sulfur cluster biosynthetic enzyme